MIPAAVWHALQTVRGLRAGKSEARETRGVRPVPRDRVDAVLPFLPQPVRAMVELEYLSGMRPGELCRMRGLDLETGGRVWVYRPGSDQGPHGKHKTAHHGKDRMVFLGPRAQEILKSWLKLDTQAYLFSPIEAEERRGRERRQNRKSPMTPSQARRTKKKNPKRPKRDRYDETSYRNAIYRACDKAFPPPEPLARRQGETATEWAARLTEAEMTELSRWRSENRWHPNRLRHSAATNLRREYGIEMAKIILGHSTLSTTLVYAERDVGKAAEVVGEIG
jgi:integrase